MNRRNFLAATAILTAGPSLVVAQPPLPSAPARPGRRNLITDVPGLKVGQAQDVAARTGATWLTQSTTLDDTALRTPVITDALSAAMTDRGHLTCESRPAPESAVRPSAAEVPPATEPTLAERRRAGRAAERATHREQLPSRNGRTVRTSPSSRRAPQSQQPAERTDQRPTPAQQPTVQQPPQQRPDQQGPRIR